MFNGYWEHSAENLSNVTPYADNQNIIRALRTQLSQQVILEYLYGNLASEGAVAKITGKEGTSFEGKVEFSILKKKV